MPAINFNLFVLTEITSYICSKKLIHVELLHLVNGRLLIFWPAAFIELNKVVTIQITMVISCTTFSCPGWNNPSPDSYFAGPGRVELSHCWGEIQWQGIGTNVTRELLCLDS